MITDKNILGDELLKRILGIQTLISSKTKQVPTIEELVTFISEATTSDEFELWTKDLNDPKKEMQESTKIMLLLSRTADSNIAKLYFKEQLIESTNKTLTK